MDISSLLMLSKGGAVQQLGISVIFVQEARGVKWGCGCQCRGSNSRLGRSYQSFHSYSVALDMSVMLEILSSIDLVYA